MKTKSPEASGLAKKVVVPGEVQIRVDTTVDTNILNDMATCRDAIADDGNAAILLKIDPDNCALTDVMVKALQKMRTDSEGRLRVLFKGIDEETDIMPFLREIGAKKPVTPPALPSVTEVADGDLVFDGVSLGDSSGVPEVIFDKEEPGETAYTTEELAAQVEGVIEKIDENAKKRKGLLGLIHMDEKSRKERKLKKDLKKQEKKGKKK